MVVRLGGGGGGAGTQVVGENPRVLAHCGRVECQGHSGYLQPPGPVCAWGGLRKPSLRESEGWSCPQPLPCQRSRLAHPPPTWCTFMLVFLQMPVQVGLLPKAAVAQVAFERLLFVVDVPHVPLEVGGDAERPVTVLAPGKQVHLASEERRSRVARQGPDLCLHGSCSHCGAPEATWLPSWRVQMYPRVAVSRDVYALFKLPQLVERVRSQGTQCEMIFSGQPQEGSLETWKEAGEAGWLP